MKAKNIISTSKAIMRKSFFLFNKPKYSVVCVLLITLSSLTSCNLGQDPPINWSSLDLSLEVMKTANRSPHGYSQYAVLLHSAKGPDVLQRSRHDEFLYMCVEVERDKASKGTSTVPIEFEFKSNKDSCTIKPESEKKKQKIDITRVRSGPHGSDKLKHQYVLGKLTLASHQARYAPPMTVQITLLDKAGNCLATEKFLWKGDKQTFR